MSAGEIPLDDNYKPVLALMNDATGQVVPLHVGGTIVGADGKTYAQLGASLYAQATNPGDTPVLVDPTFGGLSITDFIRYHILKGHGYRVTTGQIATGGANAWIGAQGVANNLSVNVLIYNILVSVNASTSDVRLYQNAGSISTDAGLTSNLLTSILNQKIVGAASALSTLNGSAAGTTQANPSNAGTLVGDMAVVGNSTLNVLSNGSLLWLPKSTQNTFGIYAIEGTSGNKVSITIEWIEF